MQATGAQPCRLAVGAQLHYERHRPEHSTLYRLVQQHGASLFEQAERAAGAELPPFVKDEVIEKCGCSRNSGAVRACNLVGFGDGKTHRSQSCSGLSLDLLVHANVNHHGGSHYKPTVMD